MKVSVANARLSVKVSGEGVRGQCQDALTGTGYYLRVDNIRSSLNFQNFTSYILYIYYSEIVLKLVHLRL